MIKLLITICVIGAVGGAIWWQYAQAPTTSLVATSTTPTAGTSNTNSTESPVTTIERVPSASDRQVYINQDWRFSFEYPSGWRIEEPAFGSKNSLLNLAAWPTQTQANLPHPILVNITPKWWIGRLLEDISSQNNSPSRVIVDDMEAIVSSYTYMSVPSIQYLVLINDQYWIDISARIGFDSSQGYADELEMVRSSFKFHEPLPTLEELGIEPYMPAGQTAE